jgi:hypothetical protein
VPAKLKKIISRFQLCILGKTKGGEWSCDMLAVLQSEENSRRVEGRMEHW